MERKKGIAAICIAVAAVICVYNGVSYFQKKQCADNPYKEYATKEKAGKRGVLNTHTEPAQRECGLQRSLHLMKIFPY